PLPRVPDCQAEHSIQSVKYLIAPLFVSVDDYLCIRVGSENVAVTFEFSSDLLEVVDFAVEDHPNRFFLIRHRLMAARKVDDRKSAESKAKRSRDVKTVIIGASMNDGFRHRLDIPAPNRRLISEVILSANSAHKDP